MQVFGKHGGLDDCALGIVQPGAPEAGWRVEAQGCLPVFQTVEVEATIDQNVEGEPVAGAELEHTHAAFRPVARVARRMPKTCDASPSWRINFCRVKSWPYSAGMSSFLSCLRSLQRFKSLGSAQRFLSMQSVVYNEFNLQRRLIYLPRLPVSFDFQILEAVAFQLDLLPDRAAP